MTPIRERTDSLEQIAQRGCCSRYCCKTVKKITGFSYDVLSKVALHILFGIACGVVLPVFAPSFFAFAAAAAASHFTVIVLSRYNITLLAKAQLVAHEICKKHWILTKVVALMFAAMLALIHLPTSIVAASGVGLFTGLSFKIQRTMETQKRDFAEEAEKKLADDEDSDDDDTGVREERGKRDSVKKVDKTVPFDKDDGDDNNSFEINY